MEKYALIYFGEDEGRMGSSWPYFIAINKNNVLICNSGFDNSKIQSLIFNKRDDFLNKLKNTKRINPAKDISELIENGSFVIQSENGWDFNSYPIKSLINSIDRENKAFNPDELYEYNEEDFIKSVEFGGIVNAGMGNWGHFIGFYNIDQDSIIKKT